MYTDQNSNHDTMHIKVQKIEKLEKKYWHIKKLVEGIYDLNLGGTNRLQRI